MKKAAVIGYGGMGQWHVAYMEGLSYCGMKMSKSDVVTCAGIYDIDPKKAELARLYGLHAYDTVDELLADDEVELVVIAVPNDLHEYYTIKCLEAGKNVICEKPVAMSSESLERMIDAANRSGKIFSVHQNRRWDSYFVTMKRLAEEDIQEALVSRRGIDAEMARRISRLANGSWLKALEELQVGSENELFLDMYIMLMRLAYQRKIKDLRKWSEQMAGMGREKQKRWLTFFLRMTRENFMYNFQNEELVYMTQKEEDFARNFARFVNEKNILQMNDMANLCIRDIGQNANARIVFFDFALQMIVLLLQK